jgi:hypothetical protein
MCVALIVVSCFCNTNLFQRLFIKRLYCVFCALVSNLLLLLLLQIRTQPHLGYCLAAATAAASAIFMHLCTNSATPHTSRQHMRSCNNVNGNCANRRSRLTTAVAGHEKRRWASICASTISFLLPYSYPSCQLIPSHHVMSSLFAHHTMNK